MSFQVVQGSKEKVEKKKDFSQEEMKDGVRNVCGGEGGAVWCVGMRQRTGVPSLASRWQREDEEFKIIPSCPCAERSAILDQDLHLFCLKTLWFWIVRSRVVMFIFIIFVSMVMMSLTIKTLDCFHTFYGACRRWSKMADLPAHRPHLRENLSIKLKMLCALWPEPFQLLFLFIVSLPPEASTCSSQSWCGGFQIRSEKVFFLGDELKLSWWRVRGRCCRLSVQTFPCVGSRRQRSVRRTCLFLWAGNWSLNLPLVCWYLDKQRLWIRHRKFVEFSLDWNSCSTSPPWSTGKFNTLKGQFTQKSYCGAVHPSDSVMNLI